MNTEDPPAMDPLPASVVIAGGGPAGFSVARELRRLGFSGRVTIADPQGMPYDRPPLSKAFLAGGAGPEALALADAGWYAEQQVVVVPEAVAELLSVDPQGGSGDGGGGDDGDTPARSRRPAGVRLASGRVLHADTVVLATGARARTLPLPGARLPGVQTLRTAADALRLRAALRPGSRLAVLGAGLIGAEVAATAGTLGADVVLIDPDPLPLAGAAGPEMARYLRGLHQSHGIVLHTGRPAAIGRSGSGLLVTTAEGEGFPADAVLVAVGAEPDTALAAAAGLEIDGGIVVDAAGRTSRPAVFAAGDAIRVRNAAGALLRRSEHWEAATRSGAAAAAGIMGLPPGPTTGPGASWFWTDRHGVHVEVVGDMTAAGVTVLRGEPGPGFMAFRLAPSGVLAGAAAVDGGVAVRAVRRIIEAGIPVEAGQLADPQTDLRRLARRR